MKHVLASARLAICLVVHASLCARHCAQIAVSAARSLERYAIFVSIEGFVLLLATGICFSYLVCMSKTFLSSVSGDASTRLECGEFSEAVSGLQNTSDHPMQKA